MVALVLMAPEAIDRVEAILPDRFPKPVFNAIRRGVVAQANRFVAEL
jgi:serine/threonine-protein kinase HipA